MFNSKDKSRRVISEINITPFVDVLLVILIIFMITAPMLDNGFDVSLPKSVQNQVESGQEKQIVLSIDKNSNLLLENTKVTLSGLSKTLKQYDGSTTKVFLKADKNVRYQAVIDAMSFFNKNGFNNISLVTEGD